MKNSGILAGTRTPISGGFRGSSAVHDATESVHPWLCPLLYPVLAASVLPLDDLVPGKNFRIYSFTAGEQSPP